MGSEVLQKVLSVTRGVLFVAIGVVFVGGALLTWPEDADHFTSRNVLFFGLYLLRDLLKTLF
jgi:hypothetical protein